MEKGLEEFLLQDKDAEGDIDEDFDPESIEHIRAAIQEHYDEQKEDTPLEEPEDERGIEGEKAPPLGTRMKDKGSSVCFGYSFFLFQEFGAGRLQWRAIDLHHRGL